MSDEKYGFVYVWYNRWKKKFYVGCHWGREDDGYVCSSRTMNKAYKRTPQNFKRRVVSRVYTNRTDLLTEEHKWLSQIKDEQLGKKFYNLSKHHFGHWTSTDRAEEIKQKLAGKNPKLSEAMKGNKNGLGKVCSEEKKRKISEAQRGRCHKTEEQNRLHSELMKGRAAWNKGKNVWSAKDKARISEQSKGRKMSEATREKMRISQQMRRAKK